MAEKWVQGELYPSVTTADKQRTRILLTEYTKKKMMVDELSKRHNLTPQQKQIYQRDKRLVDNITLAFNLIQDEEVKRIIEHRFFKLRRYKNTSIHFRSIMSERTIDRRIDEGIQSIADSLKLWGII
ncbi:hypothetical protein J6TS7_31740 [Paenibacillus dendritiformis]|nr:hypothetical protein J6TS7_31740 [Paenibacillus dendritiformis]